MACLQCGAPLVGKRSDAKWCSSSCAKLAQKLRDPERTRTWQRGYRERNRQTLNEKQKAYYQTHKEEKAAYDKDYYARNQGRIKAKVAEWQKANRERQRLTSLAYVHRRRANGGEVTIAEWQEKLELFAGLCVYCGQPGAEQDHVVPLSRGGEHIIDNIVPACRSCNASKGDKLLSEWVHPKAPQLKAS